MAKKAAVSKFLVDGRVLPFAVIANKAMSRGGRAWTVGIHLFETAEKIDQLGAPEDVAAMLDTIALYPGDFEIKQAGEVEQKAEA